MPCAHYFEMVSQNYDFSLDTRKINTKITCHKKWKRDFPWTGIRKNSRESICTEYENSMHLYLYSWMTTISNFHYGILLQLKKISRCISYICTSTTPVTERLYTEITWQSKKNKSNNVWKFTEKFPFQFNCFTVQYLSFFPPKNLQHHNTVGIPLNVMINASENSQYYCSYMQNI